MIVTLRLPVVKRCPFTDESDSGTLLLVIHGPAPELHDLEARIGALTAIPVSHEDFTEQVAALLPPGTAVVTRWKTGSWDVEVRVLPVAFRAERDAVRARTGSMIGIENPGIG